ncbi:hypothetical protein IQ276_034790 [Desmonostoc muscorum LEGE 12446]|uniref:Uncharacterized protein n=1 Tax=Desmonostoc muscorum LEGE 12446 TaxID=1828758 RepID=A0A8J6ZZY4_DESMC|nr:hypothetical protein [Desmonostoc muscorum]MCF2151491.1 hypothetical protein [Desmonostoc muscorum LEGE 12446]
MEIEIQGRDAVQATEKLLAIEGLEGSYQTIDEVERGEPLTLTTIATIVGIVSGTVTIAKEIYEWYQKSQKSKGVNAKTQELRVLLIGKNGQRLLLTIEVTEEQIRKILEDEVR